MPDPYASYEDFTIVNSIQGVSQSAINSHWLFLGSSRVDEALGDIFATPFSSNNQTAKELCIDFAIIGIMTKSKKKEDSEELREGLAERIAMIRESRIMRTDEGATLRATGEDLTVFSNTERFKPTADFRDPMFQRIDPDRLDDDWNRDS